MTRFAAFFTLIAAPALAHPGHFAPVGGHDHWALFAGLGVIVLAVFVALKKPN